MKAGAVSNELRRLLKGVNRCILLQVFSIEIY